MLTHPTTQFMWLAWFVPLVLHKCASHRSAQDAVFHYNRTITAVLSSPQDTLFFQHILNSFGFLAKDILQQICSDTYKYTLMVMIMNNLGQALSQQGMVESAIKHHRAAARLLTTRIELLDKQQNDDDTANQLMEAQDNLLHSRAHIFRASKVSDRVDC